MREILFRGKRVDNGEWVYGDLSQIQCRVYISQFVLDDTFQDGAENKHLYKHIWVLPETVGQFTGLKDKNGNKIFEGDIIRWTTSTYYPIMIVDFINGVFCIKNKGNHIRSPLYHFCPLVEVIGNVIDNPELLEVANG